MISLLRLFLSFLKVGVISFGGGYGMISVLREEVLSNAWLSEEEFLNFIAISESTPGPIAINMATFVGASQGGFLGSLLATLGVVIPSFTIIIIIATVIKNFINYTSVKSVLNGIKPAVAGLITATALTMILSNFFGLKTIKSDLSFDYKSVAIMSIVVLVATLFKKFTKKKISPILLIVISAGLGMFFYGVI